MFVGMRRRMGTWIAVVAGILALGMVVPGIVAQLGGANGSSGPVVATVNRRRVSAADLDAEFRNQYYERASRGDFRPDQIEKLLSDVMDTLIDNALILDAAQKAKFVVDKARIDSSIKDYIASFGGEKAFDDALRNAGYTRATFTKMLEQYAMVEEYPKAVSPEIEVTDEEILAELGRSGQTDEIPDNLRPYVEQIIRSRKAQEQRKELVAKLHEGAKIKIQLARVNAYRAMLDGKYDRAIKDYKAAIKQQPSDPYLQLAIAKAYAASGKSKESEAALTKAVSMSPDNPYIYIARAEMAIEADNSDKAAGFYKKASELGGEDVLVYSLVANGFTDLGLEDEARAANDKIDAIQEAYRAQLEAKAEAEAKAKADAEAKDKDKAKAEAENKADGEKAGQEDVGQGQNAGQDAGQAPGAGAQGSDSTTLTPAD